MKMRIPLFFISCFLKANHEYIFCNHSFSSRNLITEFVYLDIQFKSNSLAKIHSLIKVTVLATLSSYVKVISPRVVLHIGLLSILTAFGPVTEH